MIVYGQIPRPPQDPLPGRRKPNGEPPEDPLEPPDERPPLPIPEPPYEIPPDPPSAVKTVPLTLEGALRRRGQSPTACLILPRYPYMLWSRRASGPNPRKVSGGNHSRVTRGAAGCDTPPLGGSTRDVQGRTHVLHRG